MFKAYVPQQGELLPAHVGEALDPSDPALFIDDLVESLDLRRFEKRYRRRGERAFPPRMLLKLWLLGAVVGVYSGRELARRLHYDRTSGRSTDSGTVTTGTSERCSCRR